MKDLIIVGLVCLVAALVFGFEPVQRTINVAIFSGTLRGVESCMDYSRSDLLSEEAVQATCISSFQRRLFGSDFATGRAGLRLERGEVSWGGLLRNETSDHVTTWVNITVYVFDAEGNEQEFEADTAIWIDPLGEAEFIVNLPDLESEQIGDLRLCDHESVELISCMTWGIYGVEGLSI